MSLVAIAVQTESPSSPPTTFIRIVFVMGGAARSFALVRAGRRRGNDGAETGRAARSPLPRGSSMHTFSCVPSRVRVSPEGRRRSVSFPVGESGPTRSGGRDGHAGGVFRGSGNRASSSHPRLAPSSPAPFRLRQRAFGGAHPSRLRRATFPYRGREGSPARVDLRRRGRRVNRRAPREREFRRALDHRSGRRIYSPARRNRSPLPRPARIPVLELHARSAAPGGKSSPSQVRMPADVVWAWRDSAVEARDAVVEPPDVASSRATSVWRRGPPRAPGRRGASALDDLDLRARARRGGDDPPRGRGGRRSTNLGGEVPLKVGIEAFSAGRTSAVSGSRGDQVFSGDVLRRGAGRRPTRPCFPRSGPFASAEAAFAPPGKALQRELGVDHESRGRLRGAAQAIRAARRSTTSPGMLRRRGPGRPRTMASSALAPGARRPVFGEHLLEAPPAADKAPIAPWAASITAGGR